MLSSTDVTRTTHTQNENKWISQTVFFCIIFCIIVPFFAGVTPSIKNESLSSIIYKSTLTSSAFLASSSSWAFLAWAAAM